MKNHPELTAYHDQCAMLVLVHVHVHVSLMLVIETRVLYYVSNCKTNKFALICRKKKKQPHLVWVWFKKYESVKDTTVQNDTHTQSNTQPVWFQFRSVSITFVAVFAVVVVLLVIYGIQYPLNLIFCVFIVSGVCIYLLGSCDTLKTTLVLLPVNMHASSRLSFWFFYSTHTFHLIHLYFFHLACSVSCAFRSKS